MLDEHFKKAMETLPVPYTSTNPLHKQLYTKFMSTYGTHYVDSLVLGGKRILSTTMTSSDYSQLVKSQVDVAATLSFDMQFALGSPEYVQKAMSDGECCPSTNFDIGEQVDSLIDALYEETGVPSGGVSGRVSLEAFASSSVQAESAVNISKKKISTSEVNVGGKPNVDWREWAASVSASPMP